jgi:hypothetical protein
MERQWAKDKSRTACLEVAEAGVIEKRSERRSADKFCLGGQFKPN